MDSFYEIFEQYRENNVEINDTVVEQFKQLVINNGILEDEFLLEKWQAELEAIIFNQNKFKEAEFQLFKTKVLKNTAMNNKLDTAHKSNNGRNDIGNPSASKYKSAIENIKGDANIFNRNINNINNDSKNQQIPASKQKNNAVNKDLTEQQLKSEETMRSQIGKETLLDPARFTYNNHLPQIQVEKNQKINFQNAVINSIYDGYNNNQNKNKIPNYLNIKLDKIRDDLSNRIQQFKQYYSQYLLPDEKFINDMNESDNEEQQLSKTNEIKMVGRIVSTEKGFLNTTNVRIELNKQQYYDLVFEDEFNFNQALIFSNQIIMVTGLINERGQLVVSELNTTHQKDVEENNSNHNAIADEIKKDQDNNQLILVAAGPFTSIMSNEYTAFDNILHAAKTRKVSTLILLGPFLDEQNTTLKDGDIEINNKEYTYEQLQNSLFERALQELGGATQIIVVPSTKDILSHDSIPQTPLEIQVSQQSKSIHQLTNPAYFELQNELSIYIANSDIAMNTLQNSLFDKKLPFTQQTKLVYKALFNQNNLFALYPQRNPLQSNKILEIVKLPNIYDFDIEFDHELNVYPKIIISPSSIPKFVYNINNTIVINPNTVVRDSFYPGKFALITYFKNNNNNVPLNQRIRVDLYSL